jgi:hypothetical protein
VTPLLLALDHLRVTESAFHDYLLPHLLAPVSQGFVPVAIAGAAPGRLASVHLVLALSEDERRRYDLGALVRGDDVIRIDPFDPDEFVPYAREFYRHHQYPLSDRLLRWIDATAGTDFIRPTWKPEMLRRWSLR